MEMTHRMAGIRNERGMALIGVLVLSALLMVLATTLAVAVRSDTQLRGAFASGVTGFYAAESGLNMGMGEYRKIFLDYNVPAGNDFNPRFIAVGDRQVRYKLTERAGNPQNIVIPSGELFAGLNAIQYRYIVNSTATDVNGDVEAGVGAEFLVGYIPLFQFVAFYKDDLEILPGATMTLNGRIHTNGRLYLNSDASLTIADNPAAGVLTVQVSAGKGIYRGRKNSTASNGTVTVDMLQDVVAPFGNLDPRVLNSTGGTTRLVPDAELAQWRGSMIGTIGNIAIPEPDIIKPPASLSSGGESEPGVYWEKADLRLALLLNTPGQLPLGPILPHSIVALGPTGAIDAAKTTELQNFMRAGDWNSGRFAGQGPSSLPGTMPVFYTDLPYAAGSGVGPGDETGLNSASASYVPVLPVAAIPNRRTMTFGVNVPGVYAEAMGQPTVLGTVTVGAAFTFDLDYRRGGFYNHREDDWMLLLNINVRDLILWNAQNGQPFFATNDNSEGGIVIFTTVVGPESGNNSNNYGIRVFGSADIPLAGGIGVSADPTGVTVATDQAIYVVGNFNRGTAAGGLPRQPASLIGDSVNVMSDRYWRNNANCPHQFCRDGQSVQSLAHADRDAQNTFINAAFLGGVDPTVGGNYNGGLENYPRFHEDWGGGQTLTYQGAFVSLGEAEHVNGPWCGTGGTTTSGCNIYNPPVRAWNFDAGYNNAANLPPLTPRFVYVQQVLFTEDFK